MRAVLFGTRVWPANEKRNGEKVEIAKNQYTELTLGNVDSKAIELFNVETELFSSWNIAKEDFAKIEANRANKIFDFETQTKFGKIKIVGCAETDAVLLFAVEPANENS